MKTNLITDIIAENVFKDENGDYHREDGPAYIGANGICQIWYIHGQKHREDGPAVIWKLSDEQYFLEGVEYTKDDWEKEVMKLKLKRLTDL